MGRPRAIENFDTGIFSDLASRGMTQKDIALEMGISIPTLERCISELSSSREPLLKYRELQNLQLTSIQARVLDAITPEKIAEASLTELVQAFKILKDKELVDLGKPTEIKGLVGYLVEMEKIELGKVINFPAGTVKSDYDDADIDEDFEDSDDDDLPKI